MIKLGLIGTPIAHSLSPEIHQGFMTATGISGSYDLFEMEALPKKGLKAFMQHHGLIGLNVTIPFKEEVFNCLLYTSPSPRDLSTSRMPSSA